MKHFVLVLVLGFALVAVAVPAVALGGDLFITGVDPLLVQNAGGCKKIDAASVRCSFDYGRYTYVYFDAKRPKFEQCSIGVSRGPGPKWRIDAAPCIAKWNGDHVYVSVPK